MMIRALICWQTDELLLCYICIMTRERSDCLNCIFYVCMFTHDVLG